MNRIVVNTRASGDGSLHLDLPAGSAEPDSDVQVTVEPLRANVKRSSCSSAPTRCAGRRLPTATERFRISPPSTES